MTPGILRWQALLADDLSLRPLCKDLQYRVAYAGSEVGSGEACRPGQRESMDCEELYCCVGGPETAGSVMLDLAKDV